MSPYLDNIETLGTSSHFSNSLTLNDSETSSFDSLYSFDQFSNSFENLSECKRLSVDTAEALREFGDVALFKKRSIDMLACGSSVGFDSTGRLVSANFCRSRLCPLCQRRKSLRTYSDFKKMLEHLKEYSFLHLVLTVPNVEGGELSRTLDEMNKASSRFFKIKEVEAAFKGIVRCTEISYNEASGTFHPHFHNLIAVNKSYFTSRLYLKFDRLRFLWSATWHYRESNMKRLTDSQIMSANLIEGANLQIYITKADENALPEIAKYALKPLKLTLSAKKERRYWRHSFWLRTLAG